MRLSAIGQFAVGALGAAARHDRHQVLEISGPGIGHLHPAARLGKASRVDGRQHLGRQIDWQTEQFAHDRGGDDAAVLLGEVEGAARQQFVESLVGQRTNPVGELGDGFRPELTRGAPPDAVIDRGVEVRVERHGMQRRIRHGPVVVLGQNRCGGQGSLRCDERPVVDLQHLPDVGEPGQRVGVPLLDVVHGVLVAQHAVVRQRIGHHGRIERIVREVLPAQVCSLQR